MAIISYKGKYQRPSLMRSRHTTCHVIYLTPLIIDLCLIQHNQRTLQCGTGAIHAVLTVVSLIFDNVT